MNESTLPRQAPATLTPGAGGTDPMLRYWLGQATLRLRRDICWLWRERSPERGAAPPGPPPFADPAVAALDQLRYDAEKRGFFAADATARYLGEQIAGAVPPPEDVPVPGSFGWLAQSLRLNEAECFVLALALLPALDSAAGAVVACCQDDPARVVATPALAQRLWDDPDAILACLMPGHPFFTHGLLAAPPGAGLWQAPLQVPPLLARLLAFPEAALAPALETIHPAALPDTVRDAATLALAGAATDRGMRIVPLLGAPGAPLPALAAGCAALLGMTAVRTGAGLPREDLAQAMSAAWLRGAAFYLDGEEASALPLPGLPLTVFVGLREREGCRHLPAGTAPIVVPPLTHAERLALWRRALPEADAGLAPELAQRFRYEAAAIARVGAGLAGRRAALTPAGIFAAARAAPDFGGLAQPVTPRFARDELMLPPHQSAQIDELIAAMRNLTRAHHDWGTARAWNEGGLGALFHGAPGTGKTMAAEAIAASLALPLYRIDLSQVVDKYVGETEKNLRRLFDAADGSDAILFFDEADALFGKRSAVKDAHDRYANLEISYLLERMERFKGLAILATNRRKDLDEAFLRRLRFAVEFPLPGPAERLRIWRAALPREVDTLDVDLDFLAGRFALAGGHIRSIVFHACLQGAFEGAVPRLTMAGVLLALQREFEKLERASSLDQFGPYARLLENGRSR